MHRIVWTILWLTSFQMPAYALDIWCSTLMGAYRAAPPLSKDLIKDRADGMRASPAFRRPFDFEGYLRDHNALAIQSTPECVEAVLTGKSNKNPRSKLRGIGGRKEAAQKNAAELRGICPESDLNRPVAKVPSAPGRRPPGVANGDLTGHGAIDS